MLNQVSKSQFKAKALEYFRQIEASSESMVVTDHGEPKLEIWRLRATHRQSLELLRGTVLRFDQPTEPVAEQDWAAAK